MSKLPPGPYEWMNRDLMDSDGNAIIIDASCDPALRHAIAALPELVEALKRCRDELRYWLPTESCAETAAKEADAALEKAGLGDDVESGLGKPGIRDPNNECNRFTKSSDLVIRDCNGDGHYLCSQCARLDNARRGSRG